MVRFIETKTVAASPSPEENDDILSNFSKLCHLMLIRRKNSNSIDCAETANLVTIRQLAMTCSAVSIQSFWRGYSQWNKFTLMLSSRRTKKSQTIGDDQKNSFMEVVTNLHGTIRSLQQELNNKDRIIETMSKEVDNLKIELKQHDSKLMTNFPSQLKDAPSKCSNIQVKKSSDDNFKNPVRIPPIRIATRPDAPLSCSQSTLRSKRRVQMKPINCVDIRFGEDMTSNCNQRSVIRRRPESHRYRHTNNNRRKQNIQQPKIVNNKLKKTLQHSDRNCNVREVKSETIKKTKGSNDTILECGIDDNALKSLANQKTMKLNDLLNRLRLDHVGSY